MRSLLPRTMDAGCLQAVAIHKAGHARKPQRCPQQRLRPLGWLVAALPAIALPLAAAGTLLAQPQLMARNNRALNLARALVYLGDLCIAEVALNGQLFGVAHAAMQLQRAVGAFHGCL
ncbi:short-chain specific acyl-CoA dehydrogenase, mitochondrial [Chloroflexota bacterium]|nr:short-chain specific acyl-CoA dehydrogenase, mitochondrial [Chloroflexota bacterium]